jgi:hypothetical protein
MIAQAGVVSQSIADSSAEAPVHVGSSAPVRPVPPRNSSTPAQTVGQILLAITGLAIACCMLLALIGVYANPSGGPKGIEAEVEHANQAVRFEQLAPARSFQQGLRLVGVGAVGSSNQGMSVALSADGGTAIVGGPGPNNADHDRSPFVGPAGAAWIFTRNSGAWAQQGNKLVGRTSEHGGGLWSQGASVAMSADGITAIVGGPSDDKTMGAVWVFTRSGTVWTQQGNKLVGSGVHRTGEPLPSVGQGMSVALSGDGNTAIVGGWRAEGVWVFTRKDSVWTQQGDKLIGAGAVGDARQGMSVALSADGNTAIVGGWSDNNKAGAAWVFVRSRGVWTQQGKKLVGSDAVGNARQGMSVALSADGNTAIVGGPDDNLWDRSVPFGLGAAGAAWVFTRSAGLWTQQGNKLASKGSMGSARQGMSVALSADGNTAIVGGLADDRGVGAASVFARSGDHWTQDKWLVGTGAMAVSSVALSGDGSIVLVGGPNVSGGLGATWAFSRSDSAAD